MFEPPNVASTVTVTVPGPGQIIATATGNYLSALGSSGLLHPDVECSLSDDGEISLAYRSYFEQWIASSPGANETAAGDLAITRVIDVPAAGDVRLDVLCFRRSNQNSVMVISRIVAQYIPG